MRMTPKTQVLKQGSLFHSFSPRELQLVLEITKKGSIPAGQYVFKEGMQAHSMFVVDTGSVEIIKESPAGAKLVVAELSSGALFGEMAFLDRSTRTAAAIAKDDLNVLEVAFDDLDRLLAKEAVIGMKLYHAIALILATRIRKTTSALSSLLLA
jgi:CRP-like cAMP-binding protein